MPRRFLPPLGAALLAVFTVGAFYFSPNKPLSRPAPVAIATNTATSTVAASTTPEAPITAPAQVIDTSELASVGAAATTTTPVVPTPNLTAVGGTLLKSTVNILCLAKRSSGFQSISGSGVVIDPRGLILTAAHIGQYFLLADAEPGNISCTIRTGGPATTAYKAEPVYVSPTWIADNAKNISEVAPKGTGENDFAVLAITESATKAALPSSFTYVPLSSNTPTTGEKLAISGYAAQYLAGSEIENDLYPTIVFDAITNRYTFNTSTIDVISVSGTAAAQEGSSGGGMADSSGGLVGIITTSSVKGDISEHIVNAITPLHIRTSFAIDGEANFDSYFAGASLPTLISNFKGEEQKLEKTLLDAN